MIQGMTGFGTDSIEQGRERWIWELRSVNSRYWECHCFLPDAFSSLEPELRRQVKDQCWRGKVEVRLRYTPLALQADFSADLPDSVFLMAMQRWAKAHDIPLQLDPIAYRQWLDNRPLETDPAALRAPLLASFSRALAELCAQKTAEGGMIHDYLMSRFSQIQQQAQQLEAILPDLKKAEQERLLERYQSWQVDPERTGEALASWSTKVDVGEELSRLAHHVQQGLRFLKETSEQGIGRALDFLIQEIQREVHTLASKISFSALGNRLLDMKILVDQLKEQVQNIA